MEAVIAGAPIAASQSRRFYLWMGVVFVLIAFGGFVPTYWARVAAGSLHAPPVTHVHGAVLFTWTLFYLAQTAWVASGRTAVHRAWGLVGISLFTLLICSIIALKVSMMRIDDAHGYGEASRRFAAIALCALPTMIAIFALAIANVRRPEVHKRLMYALMAGMMVPAIARVFLTYLAPPGALDGGPPPPFVAIPPTIVAMLLIVVAMVRDWRVERRVHAAYTYAGLALLLTNCLAVLIARTDTWLGIAGFVAGLAG